MSRRHRRAIRLLNLTRQWCRDMERVLIREVTVHDWRYSVRIINVEPSADFVRSIRQSGNPDRRDVPTVGVDLGEESGERSVVLRYPNG